MTFAGKSLTVEDEDVIEQSMNEVYGYLSFDPSSDALDSMLSAGQLELILNIELRTELAGWSGLISDY